MVDVPAMDSGDAGVVGARGMGYRGGADPSASPWYGSGPSFYTVFPCFPTVATPGPLCATPGPLCGHSGTSFGLSLPNFWPSFGLILARKLRKLTTFFDENH